MREGVTTMDVKDVQERWLDAKDEYDEKEREEWAEQAKARDDDEKAKPIETGYSSDDDLEGMSLPPDGSGIKIVRKPK
jgi:hypothetical protein